MSAKAMSNQIPINNTKQVKVPPGSETGLYYILISNLPFQTSWQQLKDHVRTVCSVERVEVFNESTSGWVMVRGRENFDAALGLLEGGLFNGRPTFADGRNADNEIMIKELVGPSTMNLTSPRSPRTPRHMSPPSMQYPTSTPISSPSTATEYSQYTTTPASSYMTSPTLDGMASYGYADNSGWYGYDTGSTGYAESTSMMPSSHQYAYDTSYQSSAQYTDYNGAEYTTAAPNQQQSRSHRSGRSHNSNNNTGFVQTEQRKIIIRGLTLWTTREQVYELVCSAGLNSNQISNVNLPMSGGSNRGYSTVTFDSAQTASAAVSRLDNHTFDGKRLKVEFTKEGVSKSEGSGKGSSGHGHGHGHHHHKHHREEGVGKKESSSKTSSSGAAGEKKDKSSGKKSVVIANGSSKKADKKH